MARASAEMTAVSQISNGLGRLLSAGRLVRRMSTTDKFGQQ